MPKERCFESWHDNLMRTKAFPISDTQQRYTDLLERKTDVIARRDQSAFSRVLVLLDEKIVWQIEVRHYAAWLSKQGQQNSGNSFSELRGWSEEQWESFHWCNCSDEHGSIVIGRVTEPLWTTGSESVTYFPSFTCLNIDETSDRYNKRTARFCFLPQILDSYNMHLSDVCSARGTRETVALSGSWTIWISRCRCTFASIPLVVTIETLRSTLDCVRSL